MMLVNIEVMTAPHVIQEKASALKVCRWALVAVPSRLDLAAKVWLIFLAFISVFRKNSGKIRYEKFIST